MTWHYLNQTQIVTTVPSGMIGFVYLIHDLPNDMLYVGKKLAITTKKMPPLKGKKNKRLSRIQTDWQDYYGSSQRLNDMINAFGQDQFTRTILHWCPNKNTMSYLEAREQFDRNVLHDARYYNGIIHCRVSARGLDGKV